MADVLWGDAALKETVAHLIAFSYIREPDGEIRLAVMNEVKFLTFRLRQCGVYSTFLQVAAQCRVSELSNLQMLETRFGCLLAKRERHGTDVRYLLRYLAKQVRHIVRTVEFLRQCDDVAALARSKIIPLVEFGVYLERGFCFLPERGFVPKAFALLLDGAIAQTLQIVCQSDCFCFLNVHNVYSYGFEDG